MTAINYVHQTRAADNTISTRVVVDSPAINIPTNTTANIYQDFGVS